MIWLFASQGNKHEDALLKAMQLGCSPWEIITVPKKEFKSTVKQVDGVILAGVKSDHGPMMRKLVALGRVVMYLDKGYIRSKNLSQELMDYYRVSVNDFQPHAYMHKYQHPADRWETLGITPAKQAKSNNRRFILYAGSSQKYCNFYGLGEATEYATKVIEAAKSSDPLGRTVIYRPKPSWRGAVPIKDTVFSKYGLSMEQELRHTQVLITHGSNACFEAALHGVPSIVLGDGITKGISSTSLEEVLRPQRVDTDSLLQLCYTIAYQQWSLADFSDGSAFDYLQKVVSYLSAR